MEEMNSAWPLARHNEFTFHGRQIGREAGLGDPEISGATSVEGLKAVMLE